MIFNQKNSKVYKNAQGLLKGAKRQFSVEKSLLLEAMLVLHPNGPEAALKDEAEAQKLLKMAPPPKKPPPKKPSKPSKPGRTQRPSAKPSAGECFLLRQTHTDHAELSTFSLQQMPYLFRLPLHHGSPARVIWTTGGH